MTDLSTWDIEDLERYYRELEQELTDIKKKIHDAMAEIYIRRVRKFESE